MSAAFPVPALPLGAVSGIDHVGIAVPDLDAAIAFYRDTLGLTLESVEVVADQKVRTAIFPTPAGRIELLESTDPEGPIAKFIAKRGPGIHHLAVQVDDVAARLVELEAAGVRLIDRAPRIGAGGHLIAFVHPAATGGVLLELCQPHTHP